MDEKCEWEIGKRNFGNDFQNSKDLLKSLCCQNNEIENPGKQYKYVQICTLQIVQNIHDDFAHYPMC